MIDLDPKKEKPRWRYAKYHDAQSPVDLWWWRPMNYNAETIWLIKVYGHITGRRYKE